MYLNVVVEAALWKEEVYDFLHKNCLQ